MGFSVNLNINKYFLNKRGEDQLEFLYDLQKWSVFYVQKCITYLLERSSINLICQTLVDKRSLLVVFRFLSGKPEISSIEPNLRLELGVVLQVKWKDVSQVTASQSRIRSTSFVFQITLQSSYRPSQNNKTEMLHCMPYSPGVLIIGKLGGVLCKVLFVFAVRFSLSGNQRLKWRSDVYPGLVLIQQDMVRDLCLAVGSILNFTV